MHRLIAAGTTALALVTSPGFAQLRAEMVAAGLSSPVAFVQDPTHPNVQLIVEQGGRIRVLENGILRPTDFLNLSGQVLFAGERGLLGLAFAPDYASSRRLFVNFVNLSGNTVVARFRRSAADPLTADPGSQFNLVWPDGNAYISQPFANHKGGHLVFGPDGYLYIGMGDGGSGGDPDHRAQNPLTLLGKMLRIDVSVPDSDAQGYDVPPGNPFVGQSGILPEIWAFGLRNPWRYSFDEPSRGGTGALVIADVGQDAWEEIDHEPAGRGGRNYGWRNREGAHDYLTTLPPFSVPLTEPIFEYSHAVGDSITGGFVYRGAALGSACVGRYFFADFVTGRIWSLGLDVNQQSGEANAMGLVEHTAEIGLANGLPASFGVDSSGELYLVNYGTGSIYRIVTSAGGASSACAAPPSSRHVGDFDGDGRADVLWRHAVRGEVWNWPMSGPTLRAELPVAGPVTGWPGPDLGWEIRGLGDQTGDGRADILWRHAPTGMIYLWPMVGSTVVSETYVDSVDPAYDIVGTGDYNGDGKSDILWRHLTRGDVWVWLMNGATVVSRTYVETVDPGYVIVGSGDLDGDRKADLVWRHATTGAVWVWLMDGAGKRSQTYLGTVPDLGYQIVGVADVDGDAKADLVWRHATRGEVWVWPMDGATVLREAYVETVDAGYRIVGTGDYDGDGQADLLWHHGTLGQVWVWLMDGVTKRSQTWVATVPDIGYQIEYPR